MKRAWGSALHDWTQVKALSARYFIASFRRKNTVKVATASEQFIYYRDNYVACSNMLSAILSELQKTLSHNDYTVKIPDHYVKVIQYAIWHAHNKEPWYDRFRQPKHIDLTVPHGSLCEYRVKKIVQWAEKYPAYLITLVMCLAAGNPEDVAWGIAEDI